MTKSSKVIVIGDIHGRSCWKEIVKDHEDADKIVFVGDYFDTHENKTPTEQVVNFKEIIDLKKAHMDKIVLLVGNHDFHYVKAAGEHYSGFQEAFQTVITEHLEEAIKNKLLQMCYQHEKFLVSHAGITKTWAINNDINISDPCDDVNELFYSKPESFRFTIGYNRDNSGDDICQPPIWVRPKSLEEDHLSLFTHVVGHTTVNKLAIFPGFILIDALGTSGEYLEIVDGVPKQKYLMKLPK